MYIIIIIATVIVSISAFQNRTLFHKLKFNAVYIKNGEWHRLFTGALVHADYMHLAFNMLALWISGSVAEQFFQRILHNELYGQIAFLIFYIVAIPMSSLYSYEKNKNNSWYNAVGASGAVSSVLFCYILLEPGGSINFIPSWLFGVIYLVSSWYMARKGNDNIGHDAHFFGAIFGILVTLIIDPSAGLDFIHHIRNIF